MPPLLSQKGLILLTAYNMPTRANGFWESMPMPCKWIWAPVTLSSCQHCAKVFDQDTVNRSDAKKTREIPHHRQMAGHIIKWRAETHHKASITENEHLKMETEGEEMRVKLGLCTNNICLCNGFHKMHSTGRAMHTSRVASSRRTIQRTMLPSITLVRPQMSPNAVPFAHSYTTCSTFCR